MPERGNIFRLLNRTELGMMKRSSPHFHQSHPTSACPVLSHRPCQLTGTVQCIPSALHWRSCCCSQRAARKHLGSCSFAWRLCQLLDVTISSLGCGSPSTPGAEGFDFWWVLPSLRGLRQWHISVGWEHALCLASRSVWDRECSRDDVSRSW